MDLERQNLHYTEVEAPIYETDLGGIRAARAMLCSSRSALVDRDLLAAESIAYVPFFPLGGGFTPYVSAGVPVVAARHGASEKAVALAWLLHRSPNILVISGTSSVEHL